MSNDWPLFRISCPDVQPIFRWTVFQNVSNSIFSLNNIFCFIAVSLMSHRLISVKTCRFLILRPKWVTDFRLNVKHWLPCFYWDGWTIHPSPNITTTIIKLTSLFERIHITLYLKEWKNIGLPSSASGFR